MLINEILAVPEGELFATQISPLKISFPQMPDGKLPIMREKKTKVLLARDDIRASLCMDDITREFTGRTFTVEDVAREFQISRKRAKQFITRLQNKNHIFFREKGYVVRSDENELDKQVS